MKIKKVPKTVQGDIDSFKMKHELRVREMHRAKMEKEHREQQVRSVCASSLIENLLRNKCTKGVRNRRKTGSQDDSNVWPY